MNTIKKVWNTAYVQKRLTDSYGNRFKLCSECHNRNDKIKVLCSHCHKYQYIIAKKIVEDGSCPHCGKETLSRGEVVLTSIFKENNIYNIPQYRIDNPRDSKQWLNIDFYLPEYNLFIEFDGKQHRMPNNWMSINSKVISHDELKNKYANDHHIKMLRLTNYNFCSIIPTLEKEFGIKLKIPKILYYPRYELPAYEIYKYIQGNSYKKANKKYTKYNFNNQKCIILMRMYRGSNLEIKKYGDKRTSQNYDKNSLENKLTKRYGWKKYDVIGTYIDTTTPIEVHCNSCDHTFSIKPHSLLYSRSKRTGGCPFCSGQVSRHPQYK